MSPPHRTSSCARINYEFKYNLRIVGSETFHVANWKKYRKIWYLELLLDVHAVLGVSTSHLSDVTYVQSKQHQFMSLPTVGVSSAVACYSVNVLSQSNLLPSLCPPLLLNYHRVHSFLFNLPVLIVHSPCSSLVFPDLVPMHPLLLCHFNIFYSKSLHKWDHHFI